MNVLPAALPLTPDSCSDSTDRCLSIEFSDSYIEVLIPAKEADKPYIHASIALNVQNSDPVKAIEEAVYANPLLLCDFRHTSLIVRNDSCRPVPHEFGIWPQLEKTQEAISGSNINPGIDITCRIDSELMKFLRRSFNNARIGSHLAPLCSYFHLQSRRSNRGRAYVQLRNGWLDVVIYRQQQLQLACSYRISSISDAIYFALAACETSGFNRLDDEMMTLSPADWRSEFQNGLRRYINYVMPLLLPADICRNASLELALTAIPNIS